MTAITTELPNYLAGTWAIDPVHSELGYSVKHLGLARSKGSFNSFSGEIVTGDNILDSSVTADIDVNSVASGSKQRDEHLLAPDFFDAANHPTMTFRSTEIRAVDEGYLIDGELTWRSVTKPVTLQAEFNGIAPNPANNDATTLGVSATATVNRLDFGIGSQGNAVLSEKVTITLEIQAPLQS